MRSPINLRDRQQIVPLAKPPLRNTPTSFVSPAPRPLSLVPLSLIQEVADSLLTPPTTRSYCPYWVARFLLPSNPLSTFSRPSVNHRAQLSSERAKGAGPPGASRDVCSQPAAEPGDECRRRRVTEKRLADSAAAVVVNKASRRSGPYDRSWLVGGLARGGNRRLCGRCFSAFSLPTPA